MRHASANGTTKVIGLCAGIVMLIFGGYAGGQSSPADSVWSEPALSLRPVEGPTKGRREARMILAPQAPVEGGGANPFFPGGCVYFQNYSSFELGDLFGSVSVVTNDDHFAGLGGMPPIGDAPNGAMLDRYIAVARETLHDSTNTGFDLELNLLSPLQLAAAPSAPIQASQLVYLSSSDDQPRTNLWWSPVSFSKGLLLDRVFFGGTELGGVLGSFQNDEGILDRFVSLAVPSGCGFKPGCAQFFGSATHPDFPAPVNQWFTIMVNQSRDSQGNFGQSVWVKTQDTVSANPPFLDPAMASGDIPAPDGEPAGWVMTVPGRPDDPTTIDVIEGIGFATSESGLFADSSGPFGQSAHSFAQTLTGVQIGSGLDPVSHPDFQPNDYFFGPLCFNGVELLSICVVPDFVVPYVDDLEAYEPFIPLVFQTDRWTDDLGGAAISQSFNTTPGGAQSILVRESAQFDAFGMRLQTQLPRGVRATPEVPIVFSSQLRPSSGLSQPGWAVRLLDENLTNDFAVSVLLGADDPTDEVTGSDTMIYVRQPNPDFDPTQPSNDNQVLFSWIPPEDWTTPPAEPLNLSHTLIPTGVAIEQDVFRELRIEIIPDSTDPDERPMMRVFYRDQELFPFGDPSRSWTANSIAVSQAQFWTGPGDFGVLETLHIDDVFFDGAPDFMAPGPGFMTPFLDDFSSYPQADTIDGHGFTPFLDAASAPDVPESQNDPQLTITPSAAFEPAPGDAVCRYELIEVCLEELDVLPPEGSSIAVRHASLPPLPDGSIPDCPGLMSDVLATGVPFEVRTPDANVRIGIGKWSLLTEAPVPHDPADADAVGFDYLIAFEPIWRVAVPQNQAVITTDPVEGANQVLRVLNPGAIDSSTGGPTSFDSVDALLPAVTAEREMVPIPAVLNELSFDLHIEGVDDDGNPAIAPPRSRLILPIESADGSRIAQFTFGGPPALFPPNMSFSLDLIRFLGPNGVEQSTGVSLIAGGEGISGPLINTWFRVIVRIDHEGSWELLIDEDRDGPLAPVSVETGGPLDADANDPDFATINSFRLEQGRDLGGDGTPFPMPVTVQSKPGGWQAVGPPDADPFVDYCFYSTLQEIFAHPVNPPQIADVETALQGLVTNVRPLGPNQDVISVLNRRLNKDNTVAGNPLVHDPCPTTLGQLNQFSILDETGSEVVYQGRWQLLDFGPPWPPQANPRPAGGISRPDGTSQTPAVSYNDPIAEPPGYPATLAPRPIILADWAMNENDGVPSELAPLPPSRWFVDNVSLGNVDGPTPCADLAGDPNQVDGADLAQLLSLWMAPVQDNPADFNGDGVVNGADLATLLANWGPCPE